MKEQKENYPRNMAIIAHLDMDAFFAAVEERSNPQWAGKPIVVGSDPKGGHGRGVVSTANYLARAYGIHSGQPIRRAWHLAQIAQGQGQPATIFVQGFWRSYSSASKRIMKIVQDLLPSVHSRCVQDVHIGSVSEVLLQQTGTDECYFDLSFAKSFPAAEQLAQKIKQEILAQENLTCSIGLGSNKLIAKIAANFKKPNGLTIVLPENVEYFLEPLSVRTLPGVGPKTDQLLHKHGINIIRDLKKYPEEELINWFGKWGISLYRKCRGIGSSELTQDEPPKSISEQKTFFHDTRDPLLLTETLHIIAKNLIKYLSQEYPDMTSYRGITVTVRFADFETHTYSHTLKKPTASLDVLKIESLRLLLPFLDHRKNPQNKLIRLIGLRIEKLQ